MSRRERDHYLGGSQPEPSHAGLLRTTYVSTTSSAGLEVTLSNDGTSNVVQLLSTPRTPMLMGESGFSFDLEIPQKDDTAHWLYAGMPLIGQFQVQSLKGNFICNVNDLSQFAATSVMCSPLEKAPGFADPSANGDAGSGANIAYAYGLCSVMQRNQPQLYAPSGYNIGVSPQASFASAINATNTAWNAFDTAFAAYNTSVQGLGTYATGTLLAEALQPITNTLNTAIVAGGGQVSVGPYVGSLVPFESPMFVYGVSSLVSGNAAQKNIVPGFNYRFSELMWLPIAVASGILYMSESLVFSLTLTSSRAICFCSDSVTDPTSNSTKYGSGDAQIKVKNLALRQVSLANVSVNQPLIDKLIKEVESSDGQRLLASNSDQFIQPVGTVAQGSVSYIVGLGKSPTFKLLRKVITVFLSPNTTDDAKIIGRYNRAVAPYQAGNGNGSLYNSTVSTGAGYRWIDTFQTYANSSPLQPSALIVARGQDFDWNRSCLEGSCMNGWGLYRNSWLHCDNFSVTKLCEDDSSLLSGFGLSGNDQMQVFYNRNSADSTAQMSIMSIPVYAAQWISKADGVMMA